MRLANIVAFAASNALLFGCQTASDQPTLQSTSQHIVVENGYHKFYVGKAVRDQLAETGTFVPGITDWYSVITLPSASITPSVASEKITLSMCDPANDITLFDHVFIGPEDVARHEASNPLPDPHYSWTAAGEFMQTYRSGAPGVYGLAQVGQLADGSLAAAAAAEFWIEYPSGDARGGGMLIGIPSDDDPHLEDPLLEDRGCKSPH